jgi:hypothetical protein
MRSNDVPTVRKIPHPEFAHRFQIACDGNPDVPLPNYGRLSWFVTQIETRFNKKITIETVRKWFAGESRPRHHLMSHLAAILKVDEAWLAIGSTPEIGEKQMIVRRAEATGVVNLVAGLISMAGGHPAFPNADNKQAAASKIDLYAVIKGAQYSFHVVIGEDKNGDVVFRVPVECLGQALVIGVRRVSEFCFELFELDSEGLELGKRKNAFIEVHLGAHPWRQIETLAERI